MNQGRPHRLRILHLIHKIDVGGAERQLLTLLGALDRENFDHRVGLLFRRGQLYDELEGMGLPIVEFRLRTRSWPAGLDRLRRYIRDQRIELVHSHIHAAGVYARVAARLAGNGCRSVYTEHSDVGRRRLLWRRLERALVPWTDYKITVSPVQRELTIRLEGFPPDRVEYIANSVDPEPFLRARARRTEVRGDLGIPESCQVVGNVSNMRYLKRLDQLIDAFDGVAEDHPRLRLLLVGTGAEYEALRAHASKTRSAERILFTGPRTDVPDLLSAMDFFAISSHSEGLPINMLEAMAAGIPVVATRVGAIGDVLEHGRTGRLVDADDVEGLIRELRHLVEAPTEARKQAEAAQQVLIERFSARTNAERLEHIYSSLASGTSESKMDASRSLIRS